MKKTVILMLLLLAVTFGIVNIVNAMTVNQLYKKGNYYDNIAGKYNNKAFFGFKTKKDFKNNKQEQKEYRQLMAKAQLYYHKAFYYYHKAAELGDAAAIYAVSALYYNGYGVKENNNKALYLEKKAAELGYKPAIFMYKAAMGYSGAEYSNISIYQAYTWNKVIGILDKINDGHPWPFSCYRKQINTYTSYYCGSFTVRGSIGSGNYIVSQSLFSTYLQHQIVFLLNKKNFSDSSLNLTTAFINYITPSNLVFNAAFKPEPVKSKLSMMAGLNDMISKGRIKYFNELVNLFIKHFIKINR
jgi:hypothetical protein